MYSALCPEGEEHAAAYQLLLLAVQREFGMDAVPEIEREPGGKPFFVGCSDLHFNVSHSHGAAVCALHDKPVGIDVERVRKAPRRLAQGQEDREFFRTWTCKEATIKRQGLGVGALLRPVETAPECVTFEDALPGWIITVCPTEHAEVSVVAIDTAELM